jgi:hypothetical protein
MFLFDVFSSEELDIIDSDLSLSLTNPDWMNNNKQSYGKNIESNVIYPDASGKILIRKVGSTVEKIIRKFLYSTNPICRDYNFIAYYQIFEKNASFGWHNDGNAPYIATFYLNKKWTVNDGGLFIYKNQDKLEVFLPTYNSCIFMTQENLYEHCVTPVTEYSSDSRITIHLRAKLI